MMRTDWLNFCMLEFKRIDKRAFYAATYSNAKAQAYGRDFLWAYYAGGPL